MYLCMYECMKQCKFNKYEFEKVSKYVCMYVCTYVCIVCTVCLVWTKFNLRTMSWQYHSSLNLFSVVVNKFLRRRIMQVEALFQSQHGRHLVLDTQGEQHLRTEAVHLFTRVAHSECTAVCIYVANLYSRIGSGSHRSLVATGVKNTWQ